MSRKFQDITFEFKEKQYKIKSNTVFRLIQQLHEIIPLAAMLNPLDDEGKERFSVFDTCEAFSCCINYAGGDVDSEEVYCELFGENPISMRDVILRIQTVITPPAEYDLTSESNEDVKKK